MQQLIVLILCVLSSQVLAQVPIAKFSQGDLSRWENKSFAGETDYQIVTVDGKQALKAESRAAASGLYREIQIDLTQTPYLNWSWKVANILTNIDERTKAGDDFPARVYVVVSGALFWQTRSLVYVWSSNQPVGAVWDNPFTANAKHIAVRSGVGQTGQWLSEKRNIRADLKQAFGEKIEQIDAIAIMTDTDNSGQSATAWYGNISLSKE